MLAAWTLDDARVTLLFHPTSQLSHDFNLVNFLLLDITLFFDITDFRNSTVETRNKRLRSSIKNRNNGMLMLSKIQFYRKTRLEIRKGLAIRNDSVLANLFLIASSDCTAQTLLHLPFYSPWRGSDDDFALSIVFFNLENWNEALILCPWQYGNLERWCTLNINYFEKKINCKQKMK